MNNTYYDMSSTSDLSSTPTKNNSINGRVDLINYVPQSGSASFKLNPNILPMFEPVNQTIRYQHETSILNTAFFSKQNKQIIQNGIKAEVDKMTGTIVDNQSDTELTIVMTSIYFQYARNDESSTNAIRTEIEMLNTLVIDYCAKKVASNALQYFQYKKDISKLPEPMNYPSNYNIKGEKTLMLPPFL